MKWNNLSKLVLALGVSATLAACGGGDEASSDGATGVAGTINVVSREDGSGTRGAFTEITGVLGEDANGEEVDNTYSEAIIQNGTEGVLSTVAGDANAIGYVSLGSLNDTVQGVAIDGVEPTNETVQDGTYPIARNFNIAWKGDLSEVAADFVAYIHSAEGQAIAVEEGYVEAKMDGAAYAGDGSMSGTISIVGSTSVSPLMEVLAEEYKALNPDVQIDITSNGSSAGMTAAMEGTADIGMSSRELKEEEAAELTSDAIAVDGIAVVVNKENTLAGLTLEQVKAIFTGETTEWADVQ
ncbi:substrate-binding domain-containing protein [Trichococcus paludicola]|uniref:substrate-binding domain-containing protein n=1 Tax=Trichococcus paludicola TaxID=2052942 RepID=UPI000D3335A1|nr:substrate-binding domain-containing protein [Trichococcus paludicola]